MGLSLTNFIFKKKLLVNHSFQEMCQIQNRKGLWISNLGTWTMSNFILWSIYDFGPLIMHRFQFCPWTIDCSNTSIFPYPILLSLCKRKLVMWQRILVHIVLIICKWHTTPHAGLSKLDCIFFLMIIYIYVNREKSEFNIWKSNK